MLLAPEFVRLVIQHAGPKLSGYATSTATKATVIQSETEGDLRSLIVASRTKRYLHRVHELVVRFLRSISALREISEHERNQNRGRQNALWQHEGFPDFETSTISGFLGSI